MGQNEQPKEYKDYIQQFSHTAKEYPVLGKQTRFVLRDRKTVSEVIGINENLMHYVQDTALLISMIDGTFSEKEEGFDHVIYLDKSARPVSWLVSLFWDSFAKKDPDGTVCKRPKHTYVNIDRAPWFRKVGLEVSNDGRQKSNGELATYHDFLAHSDHLTAMHLSAIRSLFIEGGIENEDAEEIMRTPTFLQGKRILIVDEVSRTGATLSIAEYLFKAALPEAANVKGVYFWHPQEPMIRVGDETMLTSVPVWYDPGTSTGRGIGELNEGYYRKRYEYYKDLSEAGDGRTYDLKKLRTHAFAASVFSAPLLNDDGSVMDLAKEAVSRALAKDLCRLAEDYKEGKIFFIPPAGWNQDRRIQAITEQGAILIPANASPAEAAKIRSHPWFFLNVVNTIKKNEKTKA